MEGSDNGSHGEAEIGGGVLAVESNGTSTDLGSKAMAEGTH